MKQLSLLLLMSLSFCMTQAQNRKRSEMFVRGVMASRIAQQESETKTIIQSMISDHKPTEGKRLKEPKKTRVIYQDRVSDYWPHMMEEVLKRNNRNVFYHHHKDSVIYIDSTGKRTPMLETEATPLVLASFRGRMEQVVKDSITLSSQELAYIFAETKKASGH